MKRKVMVAAVCMLALASIVSADTFGSGTNQFNIDFVNISGDSGNLGSWPAGYGYTFSGVNHGSYRMGTYEITNDQWNKFKSSLGVPITGSLSSAYRYDPYFTGTNVPTNVVSWYEAAQFVNFLNTSKGYQPAYKFTGTQGTSGYTLQVWQSGDNGYEASNPYRNSNAYYFLPTEHEWVKAAYWNGTNLQTYATVGDVLPTAGVDTNYNYGGGHPWDVGECTQELNGTYDMMGNVWEWMESPQYSGDYLSGSLRVLRGGSCSSGYDGYLRSSLRNEDGPDEEGPFIGFRVASVPEPATLSLLALGGMMLRKSKK